jgi:NADH dehydrogenase
MTRKKVIVIGGGFAGLNVIRHLKTDQFDVLLLDKKNHHLFQPLLYQVASAALSPADIAFPLREVVKDRKNTTVLMGEVTKINKEMQTITLAPDLIFPYDYLVVAPGAKHSYFGNDHWETFAPGLKTLPDALSIRETILLSFEKAERLDHPDEAEKYLNFIVIGGGPTGVEMAGAIAEIAYTTLFKNFRRIHPEKAKVFLIEAAPRILPPYPPSLSQRAQKDLERMGVTVLLNTKVTNITENGVQTETLFIPARNIIWAAGNQAAPLLKELDTPLDRQGRVIVEPDLTIPHHPNVFVIGDAACSMTARGTPLPAVATAAVQQGCYVGKILSKEIPFQERKPFKYFDKGSLATIGKAKAVASVRGLKFSGFFAWIVWAFVHILYLVGFKNRYSVLLQWYFHYISGLRGARLINRSIDSEK